MKVILKRTAPNYRRKLSTHHIMRDLSLALLVLAVYSVGANYINFGQDYAIKAILIYLVSCATALVTEVGFAKIKEKESKVSLGKHLRNSFPLVTAMIYALILPIGTPLYVVAIGVFIAIFFGKLVFGGFGQNIFNPALVGGVIVKLSFASKLVPYLENEVIPDALSGATPTAAFSATNWLGEIQNSLPQLFMGNHGGTLGETYTFLIIILGLILAWRKVFDYRITVSYLAVCFLLSLIVGFNSSSNAFIYALTQLSIGGLMFGAIFMLTDPVTSPTSPLGKILFGMSAGFITMLIRFRGSFPEGVMFSILVMNMLTPWLDRITLGRTNKNIAKQLLAIGLVLTLSVSTVTVIGLNLEEVQVSTPDNDDNIVSDAVLEPVYLIEEVPGGYLISSNGFAGSRTPMQIEVLISGDLITSVDVISHDGETVDYGEDLIKVGTGGALNDQAQVFHDTVLSNPFTIDQLDAVDTTTGATITADGIIEAIKFAWSLVPRTDANGNPIYVIEAIGFGGSKNLMILEVTIDSNQMILVDVVSYNGETADYGKDLIETGLGGVLGDDAKVFHDTILSAPFTIDDLNGLDLPTGVTTTADGIVTGIKEAYQKVPMFDANGHIITTVKATGFGGSNNPIEMKVTYDQANNIIVNVEFISYSNETIDYGEDLIKVGTGGALNDQAQVFHDTIFSGNLTSDDLDGIDTVTGATITADGIVEGLKSIFTNNSTDLGSTPKGVLVVKSVGFGGSKNPMYIKVTIVDEVATSIDILRYNGETLDYGKDLIEEGTGGALNDQAQVFHDTIFSGNLTSGDLDGIDTVTGATITADGIVEGLKKSFALNIKQVGE